MRAVINNLYKVENNTYDTAYDKESNNRSLI